MMCQFANKIILKKTLSYYPELTHINPCKKISPILNKLFLLCSFLDSAHFADNQ